MSQKEYAKLTKFLKFFINRPNHLAKYLIENDLINKEFLKNLTNSDLDLEDGDKKMTSVYFLDVNQMNNYLNKFFTEAKNQSKSEDLIKNLEEELDKSIVDERYEDAIRIRDYLRNIKLKKKTL